MASVTPSTLADWMIARGRHFATVDEVAAWVGVAPESVSDSLQRARTAHKLVSVTKGGWVPVPPEFREAGAPPPLHYIDPMMRHLGHPYYVGFLSAARLHGASHQVPMVLQVATPALLRDRTIGGSRLQFIRRSTTADRPTVLRNVPTGRVTVSSAETTVLDLVEAPDLGAGLGNVATVIGDLLLETAIDPDQLAAAAAGYPTAVAQRAGYLFEFMADEVGVTVDLHALEDALSEATYVALESQEPREGARNRRWHVIVNTDIEHDL
jgi:predicted transcriptional regulator of viral defense system